MKFLARTSLLLVIVLVSLSAYLRLSHSGIGCPDWPSCYGQIGTPPAVAQETDTRNAYERLGEQANEPLAWATPLHRLVASVLGLLVLFLNVAAFRQKRDRVISLALLAATVFLAILGIRSGSLHSPAIIMGNLAGGFFMLALLGWMVFRSARPAAVHDGLRGWAVIALFLLGTQVVLGGLTSANFAATACMTLPDCNGAWLPGSELLNAFDLSRIHEVNSQGIAIGGAERAAIHLTHRLGGVLTLAALLVTGVLALRAGRANRAIAITIIVLAVAEVSIGVMAIVTSLPIGLAVAHNWVAALLVLALLRLLAPQRGPDALVVNV
ncbi:MAG: COX15/CtaA family protein [Gammaproteobacteria bacterium]|nr:COX15/CtaA family protein [Gammaproteobacteria bacterium]NNF61263.1 COX15/CtaA family protein [Gammaproteobacteria bacterium]NNM21705.1 COX15/CtaA family protein [Gammaproteobacteria bacterium]